MTDDDGDGIYTTTVTDVMPGAIEYKFRVKEGDVVEDFSGAYYTCTVTDPSGQFTNRVVTLYESADLDVVCWQSCYTCGDAVKITINLGDGGIAVSEEGFFIAGGGNFGNPGDNKLTDEDGDGIYTAVFEKKSGFESFYTFTNGASCGWDCKEDIAGQDCANAENFNDRFMGPITEDTTISTCFGICISCISAAQELHIDHSLFQLHPNLTNTTTNLVFAKNLNGVKTVRLFNTTGIQVAEYQLGQWATQHQIDLSNLAPGLYVVTVQAGNKMGSKKLIRQ